MSQLLVTCGLILIVQMILIGIWACVWYRRRNSNSDTYVSTDGSLLGGSVSGSDNSQRTTSTKPQIIQFTNPILLGRQFRSSMSATAGGAVESQRSNFDSSVSGPLSNISFEIIDGRQTATRDTSRDHLMN